ncbi:ParA family protein [Hymenobacter sp. NST-14]|uniref:ParA family protein n=1 Tax=Hymenobacter piscis TaxID=2839984 RepID=UPI001C022D4A|nr:ParA family protein [Hymenobacter piscis]MBT9394450.1 ParA family protein [Hymenobacter piscis]
MYLITIASQKGGSGKSTLTTAAATTLAVTLGRRVLVIDADPQQSIQNLRQYYDKQLLEENETPPYEVLTMDAAYVLDHLDKLAEDETTAPEFVFVDLPGRSDDPAQMQLILTCDLVIVPIVASLFDRFAVASFVTGLSNGVSDGADYTLNLLLLQNKVNPGQIEDKQVEEFLNEMKFPRMKQVVRARASYNRVSTIRPFSDSRYARENSIVPEAKQEMLALANAIISSLEGENGSTN